MESLEEQLTLGEVALRLNVDESTVRREIVKGRIKPVYKLGHRTVRIPASAVNRFLKSRIINGR